MAEADKIDVKKLLGLVIGILFALVAVVIWLVNWFDMTIRDEIQRKQLAHESSVLRDLHATEQARLSRYQWANQKNGVVRLPVDRAIALTLEDWDKRPSAPVPVNPPPPASAPAAPAPASAPASAPTTKPAERIR